MSAVFALSQQELSLHPVALRFKHLHFYLKNAGRGNVQAVVRNHRLLPTGRERKGNLFFPFCFSSIEIVADIAELFALEDTAVLDEVGHLALVHAGRTWREHSSKFRVAELFRGKIVIGLGQFAEDTPNVGLHPG